MVANRWRILITAPGETSVDATGLEQSVREALRDAYESVRAALDERGGVTVEVERLVRPPYDPSATWESIGAEPSGWLVTVESPNEPSAIERVLGGFLNRLEEMLGDEWGVDFMRVASDGMFGAADRADGYRVVVAVDPDVTIGELGELRSQIRAAAEAIREPIEIRRLGRVRVAWHSLPPDDEPHLNLPDGYPSSDLVTIAEIVVEANPENRADLYGLSYEFAFWAALVCHQIADRWRDNSTSPATLTVQRILVEPYDPAARRT